jgi:hypothetical protein
VYDKDFHGYSVQKVPFIDDRPPITVLLKFVLYPGDHCFEDVASLPVITFRFYDKRKIILVIDLPHNDAAGI